MSHVSKRAKKLASQIKKQAVAEIQIKVSKIYNDWKAEFPDGIKYPALSKNDNLKTHFHKGLVSTHSHARRMYYVKIRANLLKDFHESAAWNPFKILTIDQAKTRMGELFAIAKGERLVGATVFSKDSKEKKEQNRRRNLDSSNSLQLCMKASLQKCIEEWKSNVGTKTLEEYFQSLGGDADALASLISQGCIVHTGLWKNHPSIMESELIKAMSRGVKIIHAAWSSFDNEKFKEYVQLSNKLSANEGAKKIFRHGLHVLKATATHTFETHCCEPNDDDYGRNDDDAEGHFPAKLVSYMLTPLMLGYGELKVGPNIGGCKYAKQNEWPGYVKPPDWDGHSYYHKQGRKNSLNVPTLHSLGGFPLVECIMVFIEGTPSLGFDIKKIEVHKSTRYDNDTFPFQKATEEAEKVRRTKAIARDVELEEFQLLRDSLSTTSSSSTTSSLSSPMLKLTNSCNNNHKQGCVCHDCKYHLFDSQVKDGWSRNHNKIDERVETGDGDGATHGTIVAFRLSNVSSGVDGSDGIQDL